MNWSFAIPAWIPFLFSDLLFIKLIFIYLFLSFLRGLVLDIAGFVLAKWKELTIYLDAYHFPTDSLFNAKVDEVLSTDSILTMSYSENDLEIVSLAGSDDR